MSLGCWAAGLLGCWAAMWRSSHEYGRQHELEQSLSEINLFLQRQHPCSLVLQQTETGFPTND